MNKKKGNKNGVAELAVVVDVFGGGGFLMRWRHNWVCGVGYRRWEREDEDEGEGEGGVGGGWS